MVVKWSLVGRYSPESSTRRISLRPGRVEHTLAPYGIAFGASYSDFLGAMTVRAVAGVGNNSMALQGDRCRTPLAPAELGLDLDPRHGAVLLQLAQVARVGQPSDGRPSVSCPVGYQPCPPLSQPAG
jgi:hypothetical protein